MGDSSKFAAKDSATAMRMLDLMSLGAASSFGGGGGIVRAQQSLRYWHPWTNSFRRPPPVHPPAQARSPAVAAAGISGSSATAKTAGAIYDAMLAAELAAKMAGSNNNTSELEGGFKDVQTHANGGKRTTVITRLASQATNGGGVLDVKFVMETASTNNASDNSEASRSSPSESKTGDQSWMQDIAADRRKQQGLQQLESQDAEAPRQMQKTPGPPGKSLEQHPWRESKESANQHLESLESSDPMQRSQKKQLPKQPHKMPAGENADDPLPGHGSAAPFPPATESAGTSADSDSTDEIGADDGGEEADEDEGGEGDATELEDREPVPDDKQNKTSSRKKLSLTHLQKEGALIGCMNVFADVMKKEFIVLLTDRVIEAFLVEPCNFRAIARRTGCEIEVTRRILNRRIGMHRWVKYLVLIIKGPNMIAILQCDRLMIKVFPPYKIRKEYLDSAHVALFVKESYPDNSKLYFNFQRTGPTRKKIGDIRLQTPFDTCSIRPLENTPWKYADCRLYQGMLEPRNLATEHAMRHVYPEWGMELGNYVDNSQKWEYAGDSAIDIERKMNLQRSLRVKQRKMEAEPLFAEEA